MGEVRNLKPYNLDVELTVKVKVTVLAQNNEDAESLIPNWDPTKHTPQDRIKSAYFSSVKKKRVVKSKRK